LSVLNTFQVLTFLILFEQFRKGMKAALFRET